MPRSLSTDLEEAEKQAQKLIRSLWLLGLVAFALARAPRLLDNAAYSGLRLNANVGYIIIFAPFAFLLFLVTLNATSARIATLRTRLFKTDLRATLSPSELAAWDVHYRHQRLDLAARPRILTGLPRTGAILGLPVLFFALVSQFFTFADRNLLQNGHCPAPIERAWSLLTTPIPSSGQPPVRCFDVGAPYQAEFPWIYPPLQTWLYLVMTLASVAVALSIHHRLSAPLIQLETSAPSETDGEDCQEPEHLPKLEPEDPNYKKAT